MDSLPQLRKAFGPSIADALEAVVEQHPEVVRNATHPNKPSVHGNVRHLYHRKFYFFSENIQGICLIIY
jgi:hypothetical protein